MKNSKTFSCPIEDEIDKIRLAHYEETKHLSDEEFVKKINDEARQLAKEYGFTIIRAPLKRKAASGY